MDTLQGFGQLKQIFSSGGGTQSTAIAALIFQGRLHKPDFIVIADTGRECSKTWDYLDNVVRPELSRVGIDVYRIGHEWFNMPTHGKDYVNHKGNTILIGAWTNQTGQPGKLSGFCSKTWKQEPISRFLSRKLNIKPSQARKWIGFSADEWRRAQRIMVTEEYKKGLIRLPLIQDFRATRRECLEIIHGIGWPEPPRSRCWMCPNQADAEWRDMKLNYPGDFQRAVEFEKEMQLFDPFVWLHKSCIPLDRVDFSIEPTLFDSGLYCNSGTCFV